MAGDKEEKLAGPGPIAGIPGMDGPFLAPAEHREGHVLRLREGRESGPGISGLRAGAHVEGLVDKWRRDGYPVIHRPN